MVTWVQMLTGGDDDLELNTDAGDDLDLNFGQCR